MRHKWTILLVIFVAINSIAKVSHAQETTPPTGAGPAAVAAGFAEPAFWVALLATLLAGAIGGIGYELLILQGNIELPHRASDDEVTESYPYAVARNLFDLGIWARLIIGGLAAVAALLVLVPSTTFALLATAVIAGSAGSSIFSSMQDRLTAALAQGSANNIRITADKQNAKVSEALEAFTDLKKKMIEASSSPAGTGSLDFAASQTSELNLEELDRVERLLSEAKGIHEGI